MSTTFFLPLGSCLPTGSIYCPLVLLLKPPSPPGEACGTSAVSMLGWNILPSQESMPGSHISSHVHDTFSSARPSIPMGTCLWKVCVRSFLTSCDNKAWHPPLWGGSWSRIWGVITKPRQFFCSVGTPYPLTSTYCTYHTV